MASHLLASLLASAAMDAWPTFSLNAYTHSVRYGRKPSGAAAAKRAAKRRRNIAKRNR